MASYTKPLSPSETMKHFLPITVGGDINGNLSATGTITAPFFNGTALNAQWADLGEHYVTDQHYPVGTLECFGGEKELTIATTHANAVISENPALRMNSKETEGQAIALVGRVPVRVVGSVKKFDKITLSDISGVGVVNNECDMIIGRALEDKSTEEEGLVLCSVAINLG